MLKSAGYDNSLNVVEKGFTSTYPLSKTCAVATASCTFVLIVFAVALKV